MKNFKLFILIISALFLLLTLFFHKQSPNDSQPLYFQMTGDPYYKNPPKTQLHTNRINIISPSLEYYAGERYIAQDLAQYFESKGKTVQIFSEENYSNKKTFNYLGESINIFIYGWLPMWPNKNGINIVYLLYPNFPLDILSGYDTIAVASVKYSSFLSQKGFNTVYIPQFTNTHRFKPNFQKELEASILFVGSPYAGFRPSVKYALQNGFDIDVYGKGWENYIPRKKIKGDFIPNDDLHRYYSSAHIVLNDHVGKMQQNGFISNRIFDVTASRGFLISDYLPEIEEIYGDSIPMYHNADDYTQIIRYYLDHPEERKKKAQKAHEITVKNFTVEKIGDRFLEEIDKIIQKRKAEDSITIEQ